MAGDAMRRWIRAAVIVLAMLTFGARAPQSVASGPADQNPQQVVHLVQGSCKPWIIFGWRGSGEPSHNFLTTVGYDESTGIGKTLAVLFNEMQRDNRFKGKVGTAYSLEYQARAVPDLLTKESEPWADYFFDLSVWNTAHVNRGMKALIAQCPKSQVILAGYSQGAVAIGSALPHMSASDRARIRGIYLVGDPGTPRTGFFADLARLCRSEDRVVQLGRDVMAEALGIIREACKADKEYSDSVLNHRTPAIKAQKTIRLGVYADPNDVFARWDKVSNQLFRDITQIAQGMAVKNDNRYVPQWERGIEAHSSYQKGPKEFRSHIKTFLRNIPTK